jgi:hypothetical protein
MQCFLEQSIPSVVESSKLGVGVWKILGNMHGLDAGVHDYWYSKL